MGYFTLVANAVTQIVFAKPVRRLVRISTDSTTITRISHVEESLTNTGSGEIVTVYESKTFVVPENTELFAVSTGTPNVSVQDLVNESAISPMPGGFKK